MLWNPYIKEEEGRGKKNGEVISIFKVSLKLLQE